ncbi:hypothetical protein PTSG_00538 [Salpingoeca rosetta]|uniref:Sulfotransferase domain-containing protein n=1 Tax=Salpingoeca rosetta (strain ATCC 50818 / BSB-021) TaxID=946362 RepID=F2TWS1_SALR5|nr:uncharacterized protein PTSG_00538 [Salpingoeca rosetta]EGD72517.1 hypothetical protein PTSG_00538 [Salpingoeca rosetta]|eukprot:XP_004999086.1 hypothetical protein PTSG_00538 [Salpingoeca rosetta]
MKVVRAGMAAVIAALLVVVTVVGVGDSAVAAAAAGAAAAAAAAGAGAGGAEAAPNAIPGDLPKEIADHKFVFVVGAHHSGTTLLDLIIGEHEDATALKGTGKAANEGQHVQNVYKPAHDLGGVISYAFNGEAYMDETDPRLTADNRLSLYNSWAKYWNTSKPYLVEKSPRHITMTRFLQEMFTRERTYFVIIMRHPFGAFDFVFRQYPTQKSYGCGYLELRQWLTLHENLMDDIKHLENVVVVQFEQLLGLGHEATQNLANEIFEFLHLPPNVQLDIDGGTSDEAKYIHWYTSLRKTHPNWFDKDGRYIKAPNARVPLPDFYRPENYKPSDYSPPPRGVRRSTPGTRGKGEEEAGEQASKDNSSGNTKPRGDGTADAGAGGDGSATAAAGVADTAAIDAVVERTQEELDRTADGEQKAVLQKHLDALKEARDLLINKALQGDRTDDEDDDDGLAEEADVEEVGDDGATAKRRKLLTYYGNMRSHVQVHTGSVFDWAEKWANTDWSSKQCSRLMKDLEPRLGKFGYTLKNLTYYEAPKAFKDYLLHPF